MSDTAIIPTPTVPISVRLATLADLPFMDELQKRHSRQLGYFRTKQFEEYIRMGGVLIAEKRDEETERRRDEVKGSESAHFVSPSLRLSVSTPLGYVISRDKYLKREELGVIFQLCISPSQQRRLIGAALVREVFERSAYGCRLYCCWCAQDIQANHFWESLGFVPLAFRAGSSGKRRVHIFWQRRIREGDRETPYWFPSQTNSGAIREDRLVLPIPPNTHWSDVKPIVLPNHAQPTQRNDAGTRKAKPPEAAPKFDRHDISMGGLRPLAPKPVAPAEPKPKKTKPKAKNDPRHVAAARELRDRYLEQLNSGALLLDCCAKYDVSRQLPAPPAPSAPSAPSAAPRIESPIKQLPHAA